MTAAVRHDQKQKLATPPRAERHPVTTTHHGQSLTDNYAWLRAANWQEVMRDPTQLGDDIRHYLESENTYTNEKLKVTTALQETLFKEMKARVKPDDSTVPEPDGNYAYFSRFVKGKQYPQLCRRPRDGDEVTVLIDGNKEADQKKFWQLGATDHSPDHQRIAYAFDDKGSELYTICVRDIKTDKDLEDQIPDTRADMVWANNSDVLYYVRLDENHRPLRVFRHKLGTSVDEDVLIYEEKDPGFYVGLSKTQSNGFVVITTHDHQTSEIRLLDANDLNAEPVLVAKRRPGHEYAVEHHDDNLLITTNSAQSEDFRLVEAPLSDPSPNNWTERVPHKPGRLILDVIVYANHIVRLERENGLPRITITNLTNGEEHDIAFEEEAYALGVSPGYEFDTTTLRFTYSSMTTPAEVYDYDLNTRERTLRKRQQVPSGHTPEDYVTRRIEAPAPDGERIPISLLYHKNTALDGSAPVLLYGYGAYGISIPASFSTGRLSLVDRGFIYAIAHVRGGKEKGYRWYKSGKRDKKTNTFTDFIAAADHLIKEGLSSKGKIVANGGSAGGMLMGALANMAPDRFLGIIADVPFVDVLNTMLDASLPLTPPEWLEWGNPIENADEFAQIHAYSPYENVSTQNHPHILANAGLTDPRVTYWEPAKWVARLRHHNTSDNLILLHTNMGAGHAGASGRFEQMREVARNYAFALMISGQNEIPTSA